jgi:hypothetical protein
MIKGKSLTRGDEGNRTPNPCLAKAVLCQLSYVPVWGSYFSSGDLAAEFHSSSSARLALARLSAVIPATSAKSATTFFFTWALEDLNLRPLPYQGSALTRLS